MRNPYTVFKTPQTDKEKEEASIITYAAKEIDFHTSQDEIRYSLVLEIIFLCETINFINAKAKVNNKLSASIFYEALPLIQKGELIKEDLAIEFITQYYNIMRFTEVEPFASIQYDIFPNDVCGFDAYLSPNYKYILFGVDVFKLRQLDCIHSDPFTTQWEEYDYFLHTNQIDINKYFGLCNDLIDRKQLRIQNNL